MSKKGSSFMKEKLYTIPLNDAFDANTECPFCYIERKIEQDLLDFVLGSGSSYMESDIREITDQKGFCRTHLKKMFDYGNTLGNAWILKTHYMSTIQEMQSQFSAFKPAKISFKERLLQSKKHQNPIGLWLEKKENSCYICDRFSADYARYLDTFFYLYKNDDAFADKFLGSKAFCLSHFKDLCFAADDKLKQPEKEIFFPQLFALMQENMARILGDISWMIDMFDYKNKDADWKNSKDAIQRGMQKLKGGFPSDPAYRMKK